MFNLTGQCLEKHSGPAQQLARSGWHREEARMTGGGRGGGSRGSQRTVSDGRRRASCGPPTPDADGTHVRIFESLQLASCYVGGLLCHVIGNIGLQNARGRNTTTAGMASTSGAFISNRRTVLCSVDTSRVSGPPPARGCSHCVLWVCCGCGCC